MVTKELPTFCVSTRVMFGTSAMKSRWRLDARCLDRLFVNTFIVIGTFWNVSLRMRAVTTTSSRSVDD